MKNLLKLASAIGLGLSTVPAVLVFTGAISREAYMACMLAGMLLWFASAPFWMESKPLDD